MGSYALLFAISMWLNMRDSKMLLLTLVVGCGIFASVPQANFYLYCIAGEILICFAADVINAPASHAVIKLCMALIVVHLIGLFSVDYYEGDPYFILVQLFEHAQLVSCIVLSKPIITRVIK